MRMSGLRRVFCSHDCMGNLAFVAKCDGHDEFHDTQYLHRIAIINKVAATAFVVKFGNGNYGIRWFSSYGEIQFCGHATLAAADVLTCDFDTGQDEITFESSYQVIRVFNKGENFYGMCLPQIRLEMTANFLQVSQLFNQALSYVKQTEPSDGYFVAQVANKQSLIELDFDAKEYSKCTRRALLVTTNDGLDSNGLYFRYFAPQYGSKEDQATGSAAPLLASFWQIPQNTLFNCYQLSLNGAFYQICKKAQHICVKAKVIK
ncbi:PhzF family phenazine biosynthesis protein [Pseudoalteromonas luteoviolacea]|nr:PhzF family phenazine biosynthesis protein [Pseudoalteromonas luteoviolacea]